MPFDFPTAKSFQTALVPVLSRIFEGYEVQDEWCALRGKAWTYKPCVDLAVGPFSLERGGKKTQEHYDLLREHSELVRQLIAMHNSNMERFGLDDCRSNFNGVLNGNMNARCLFAIEIEATGSRKHHLGDYINAGALGRIGLIVAWDDVRMRSFFRIARYFEFLRQVDKRTFYAPNVLIVGAEQLWDGLAR